MSGDTINIFIGGWQPYPGSGSSGGTGGIQPDDIKGNIIEHDVIVGGPGKSFVSSIGIGTANQVLTSNGPGNDPSFKDVTPGSFTFAAGGLIMNGQSVLLQSPLTQGSLVIGRGAGLAQTSTSIFNTFVGWGAGAACTAAENTFVGTLAGFNVVGGAFCTAVGENALGQEISGGSNTAIGNDSQRSSVSQNGGNTSLGKNAIYGGGVSSCVAAGFSALHGNSSVVVIGGTATAGDVITLTFTGSFTGSPQSQSITVTNAQTVNQMATAMVAAIVANSAIFNQALTNTTPAVNSGTGQISFIWPGTSITGSSIAITSSITGSGTESVTVTGGSTGVDNVAIGYQAMDGTFTLTTGGANVAIGKASMIALSSGQSNVAIGWNSASLLSSGNSNVIVGASAGQAITTGQFSTFIGGSSGQNATGSGATHVGYNSGSSVTTGISTLIGRSAGQNTTTGSNTALGQNALLGAAASTANGNTSIGEGTLQLITTGTFNVVLGRNSGNKVTTGGSNLILGPGVATTTLTTGSSNIIIGVDVNADTAAAGTSDTLLIRGRSSSSVPVISSTAINTATPITALNGSVSIGAYSSAIAPTTSIITAGMAAVWKNTGDTTVKLYYNDAGSLKSIALV